MDNVLHVSAKKQRKFSRSRAVKALSAHRETLMPRPSINMLSNAGIEIKAREGAFTYQTQDTGNNIHLTYIPESDFSAVPPESPYTPITRIGRYIRVVRIEMKSSYLPAKSPAFNVFSRYEAYIFYCNAASKASEPGSVPSNSFDFYSYEGQRQSFAFTNLRDREIFRTLYHGTINFAGYGKGDTTGYTAAAAQKNQLDCDLKVNLPVIYSSYTGDEVQSGSIWFAAVGSTPFANMNIYTNIRISFIDC